MGNASQFLDRFLMWKCETFTAETAGAACFLFCFGLVFLLLVLCLIGCGAEREIKKEIRNCKKTTRRM